MQVTDFMKVIFNHCGAVSSVICEMILAKIKLLAILTTMQYSRQWFFKEKAAVTAEKTDRRFCHILRTKVLRGKGHGSL